MTKAERLAELQELRAACVAAIKSAYSAQSYSVFGRSKAMADIATLMAQRSAYDREIYELSNDTTGIIEVTQWTPE